MEQERINANVNSLSAKLLEGCKLLSESCPETNVPLVSTPNGRMFSVGNGSYYVRENNELIKVPHAVDVVPYNPNPPATPKSPLGRNSFVNFAPPTHSVEIPSTINPDGQSLSSRVAAKLLEGFTLLSESCPVTSVPLVQDAAGRILSVGTGRWYERTGGDLVEAAAPASPGGGGLAELMAAAPPPAMVVPPSATAVAPPTQPKPVGTPLPQLPSALYYAPTSTPAPMMAPPSSLPAATPYGAGAAGVAYGTGAGAAVASAVLAQAGMLAPPPPTSAAAPSAPLPSFNSASLRLSVANGGGAALKLGTTEAVAVLTSRLAEATAALADCPIREAGTYVTMIKDIGLAIAALKTL